jgi:hypothetical protein
MKKNYETALVHFQEFLNEKYSRKYSLETIIDAILSNEVDLYQLIDSFLAYETTRIKRGEQITLTSQTIRILFCIL